MIKGLFNKVFGNNGNEVSLKTNSPKVEDISTSPKKEEKVVEEPVKVRSVKEQYEAGFAQREKYGENIKKIGLPYKLQRKEDQYDSTTPDAVTEDEKYNEFYNSRRDYFDKILAFNKEVLGVEGIYLEGKPTTVHDMIMTTHNNALEVEKKYQVQKLANVLSNKIQKAQ